MVTETAIDWRDDRKVQHLVKDQLPLIPAFLIPYLSERRGSPGGITYDIASIKINLPWNRRPIVGR